MAPLVMRSWAVKMAVGGAAYGQVLAGCLLGPDGLSDVGDDVLLAAEALCGVVVARDAFPRGPHVGITAEEGDATVALLVEVGDGPARAVTVVADDGVGGRVGEDAAAEHRSIAPLEAGRIRYSSTAPLEVGGSIPPHAAIIASI